MSRRCVTRAFGVLLLLAVFVHAAVCVAAESEPALTRLATRRADTRRLWQYYWETIESCVSPARVVESIAAAGFIDVRRHVELGLFSEYTARKAI